MIASVSVTVNGTRIGSETVVGIAIEIATGIGLGIATVTVSTTAIGSVIATLVLTGIIIPAMDAPITALMRKRIGK